MSFFLENTPKENGYYSIPDLPSFSIVGGSNITAKLSYIHNGSAVLVFSGSYVPGGSNRIEIDFKDILSALLENAEPQLSSEAFVQSKFVRDIKVEISDTENSVERNFHILNIDAHCTSDIINILSKRFLTQQPNTKETTIYTPEFLTYLHSVAGEKLVAQFYYEDKTSELVTLYRWDGNFPAVTHNVSPALVLAASYIPSEHKMPFYDIYVADSSGSRISMMQRYVLKHATELDKHYLFYNSLGGLDTLTATGQLTDSTKVSLDIALTSSGLISLDNGDDHIEYSQNTGYFSNDYIKFLKDFILSKKEKYIVENGNCRKIVITESDNSFSDKDNMVSFSFKYRKDNDKPEIADIYINQELIVENPLPVMPLNIPGKTIIVNNNVVPCSSNPIECTMNSVLLHIESVGSVLVYQSSDLISWTIIDAASSNGRVSMAFEDLVVGTYLKVESDKPITHIEAIFSHADKTLMLWDNADGWENTTMWI